MKYNYMIQSCKIDKKCKPPSYSTFNLSFSYCNPKYSSSKATGRHISLSKRNSM